MKVGPPALLPRQPRDLLLSALEYVGIFLFRIFAESGPKLALFLWVLVRQSYASPPFRLQSPLHQMRVRLPGVVMVGQPKQRPIPDTIQGACLSPPIRPVAGAFFFPLPNLAHDLRTRRRRMRWNDWWRLGLLLLL